MVMRRDKDKNVFFAQFNTRGGRDKFFESNADIIYLFFKRIEIFFDFENLPTQPTHIIMI
jgi:hypothetical protein